MTDTPSSRPGNVQELVQAWKISGRKAQVLERRLQQAVDVARRYRRDLLRLAQQNRSRKLQSEDLQQKLQELVETRGSTSPPESVLQPFPDIPEGDEQVPAAYVRGLLTRLREAQSLVGEFETLLEFRERQVHQLYAREQAGEAPRDWRVDTLQRELAEARSRIRLLTLELSRSGAPAETAAGPDPAQAQLVATLQEAVRHRTEELKKAVTTIHAARERIQKLEAEAGSASGSADEVAELLGEITSLQDEIARLQDDNERLEAQASAGTSSAELEQMRTDNASLRGALSELRVEADGLRGLATERDALRAEVARLSAAGDNERSARLEAAVVDMRAKVKLAADKYQEVKQALLQKHQQYVEMHTRNAQAEKKLEVVEPMVRTLETALDESRKQTALLQRQLEEARKGGAAAPAAGGNEATAALEAKLKEARRSAVRAQAEAGLKRKEMAGMQEQIKALQAQVVSLGGSV